MKSIIKKHLVLLLLISLLFVPFRMILISNSSGHHKNFNDDSLKTAAGELTIISPESKIYTKPMYGYYPGVNSFDNDQAGTEPNWFSEINSDGGDMQVIPSLDGHNSVLDLEDTNITDNVFARKALLSAPTHGTIEFWMRTNDTNQICGFRLDGGIVIATLLAIRTKDNQLQRYNGTHYINIAKIENNKWYHIRIDFECSSGNYSGLAENSWKLYLNGGIPFGLRPIRNIINLYKTVEPFPFITNRSFADNAVWHTDWTGGFANYHYYIDAIGFSWNNFYTVMDNRNEGLLLNIHAPSNLTWMAYSLNGGINRTILGNMTIPKPVERSNTIQVFGTDSLSKIYESSILSFNVENPTWLFLPGRGGGEKASGTFFRSTLLDMDQNGISDFEDYYGDDRMVAIKHYENVSSRPEFVGVTGSSSLLVMAEAVKNFIVNEYLAGNITNRIDITGYSQGGVLARTIVKEHYYDLKKEGITINHIGILGSPCHGTWGFDGGYWKQEANDTLDEDHPKNQMASVSDFMKDLNAGDETPFGIHYNTYRGIAAPMYKPLDINNTKNDNLQPYVDDFYEYMLLDTYIKEAQNVTSIYNRTLLYQVAEEIGIYWDGAVANGSVPLSGAVNNRLYYDVNHLMLPGNKEVFKDILSDFKAYPKSEINIKIPENKTYYNPSEGHYFATNSFECDELNYKPAWFEVIGTEGGTVNVREEINDHKMVLDLHDTFNGSVNAHVRKLLSSNPTYGTVEFWMSSNDTSKICGFRIDDGSQLNEMVNIRTWLNLLWYNNGTNWNVIHPMQDDTWYHIRIDFTCATSGYEGLASYTWRIYVNGVQYGDFSFINDRNTASRLVWYTDWVFNMENYHFYIDAIGLSWDPNYEIGDNLKLGFLVDLQKTFVDNWIEYSLDGNPSIPILGDFLIPLPSEGSHSLQLFAQDWAGELIESEIIYFSKDTAPADLDLYSPVQGDLFGIIAPQFLLSVNDTNIDSVWYSIDGGLTNISVSSLSGQIDQGEWNILVNGTVYILFYANNTMGEFESVAISVKKDIINPNLTINSPIQNSVHGSTAPSYDISIVEPSGLDLVWYTFDGGINNHTLYVLTGTFDNSVWNSISDGQITLRIYAKDLAGNVGYTEVVFSKDTTETPEVIPGYNILFLVGMVSLGIFLIRTRLVKKKHN